MSIASTKKEENFTKDKVYSGKNFKKIISSPLKYISGGSFGLPLAFSIILTGIGEILNKDFSLKWYILILIMLAIYVLKEIKYGGDKPNKPK